MASGLPLPPRSPSGGEHMAVTLYSGSLSIVHGGRGVVAENRGLDKFIVAIYWCFFAHGHCPYSGLRKVINRPTLLTSESMLSKITGLPMPLNVAVQLSLL